MGVWLLICSNVGFVVLDIHGCGSVMCLISCNEKWMRHSLLFMCFWSLYRLGVHMCCVKVKGKGKAIPVTGYGSL
jgi:hypothetical protein